MPRRNDLTSIMVIGSGPIVIGQACEFDYSGTQACKALREEGYAVDTAGEGDDGLYKAENSDYDAVLLDVMLPKLDGWEVLKRLRKSKKTPVLMLTARDRSSDRVRGLDTGADDYVVKPFDLEEVFARLRSIKAANGAIA